MQRDEELGGGSGSSCGSVGRGIASNTGGLQFESSHWQKLLVQSSVLKRQRRKEEAVSGPIEKILLGGA